jgi:dihydroflavonol-4-reductase
MKVLVTGATGFTGEKLSNYLLDQGLDVRILVRSPQKAKNFSDKIEKVPGDVTNSDSLISATRGVDGVFHLAGVVGYSKSQRSEMEKVNVGGTKNLLHALQINKVPRLLHFSSVVAVGASKEQRFLNEESAYNMHSYNLGYFETKREAEELVLSANKSGFVDAVVVNPSTIYGYGDAQKGSRSVQVKVAQGKFPFYTPGGANIIAVEDVCEATLKAFQKGRSGERYILSGENLTIKNIFEMIAKEAGVEPPKISLNKAALLTIGKVGDLLEKVGKKGPLNSENAWVSVMYHWFDNGKAKRELQLNPRPAKLAIQNSVQWMRDKKLIK